MSDVRCRWDGSERPRILVGRHHDHCDTEACGGCLPCPMSHCRVCGVVHSDGACPGCLAEVRELIDDIVKLCAHLPAEVQHQGVEGEAMTLLAPAADPEAWGHVGASIASGRLPNGWQETADDERHPLWVLGTWESVYRDAFDQPSLTFVTIAGAATYLDNQLGAAAAEPWVPFEELARDLRACRAHLERVLHDGEQVDRTRVTCTNEECRKRPRLERWHGMTEVQDRWRCPACEMVYDDQDYLDAHARQLKHKGAEKYLPLRDAVSTLVAQGRGERTIRKWLAPPDPDLDDLDDPSVIVGGFCEIGSHRVWVWWPDLWRLHLTTKTRNRVAA